MRHFNWVIAGFAALGLGAISASAFGAGDNAGNVTNVDTQVDVQSTRMSGATFTAPETGAYHFTIVSGAYCYLPVAPGETSPYGGWLTQIQIHTKAVTWGAPDQWGKHPLHPAAAVGDGHHQATSAEAVAAGRGMTATVNLQKGCKVTLLVSDGSNYYGDNLGTVRVRITAEIGAPAAVAAPPVVTTPGPSEDDSDYVAPEADPTKPNRD